MTNNTSRPTDPEAYEELSDTDAGQQPVDRSGQEGHIRTVLDFAVAESAKVFAWLVFVGAVISVYEVVMRYAFNNPTSWVHETTVFLISVIFALGGPIALARDKHIRVRLIYDWVGPKARRWLDVVNSIITFVFLSGMTYAAWIMFYKSTHSPLGVIQLERSGTSWNPPFPAFTKTIILISVAVMLVQTILHLVKAFRGKGYDDDHGGGKGKGGGPGPASTTLGKEG
ncbi:putative gluconate TRAP family transporter [Caenispirillum salinarum AK4]|uniref:TRAP transporter small permease protein n=1 Tax=Caenispirillum salinarum AK4 TaxID=1238182 RepID=K9HJ15_9PROT|nr:TRAP transporter small permease [Caenispirillum salinarum]EKV28591.1 putative gluconate TRAP family transporter [Caenispirillum salinarum AK4]